MASKMGPLLFNSQRNLRIVSIQTLCGSTLPRFGFGVGLGRVGDSKTKTLPGLALPLGLRLQSTSNFSPKLPKIAKTELIYQGLASGPLRNLKKVSVTTLGVSVGITPLMGLLDFTQVSPGFVAALVFSVLSTSFASTFLIYIFTKPYTIKLYHHRETPGDSFQPSTHPLGPLITFSTLSLFGNPVYTTLRAGQLGSTTRPFTTFQITSGKNDVLPPAAKPDAASFADYLDFLKTFVPEKEVPKKTWTPREYFYMLEDRGAGNEIEGKSEEFDEVVRFAGKGKAAK